MAQLAGRICLARGGTPKPTEHVSPEFKHSCTKDELFLFSSKSLKHLLVFQTRRAFIIL